MVDDSKYVIVPNKAKDGTNPEGALVAKLVAEDYRIITKMGSREAIHYVLIKFKPGTKPEKITEER